VDIGNSATIAATAGDAGAQTIENDLQPWTRRANLAGLGIKPFSRNRFAVPSAAVKAWPGARPSISQQPRSRRNLVCVAVSTPFEGLKIADPRANAKRHHELLLIRKRLAK
jgi:hypothetical protein